MKKLLLIPLIMALYGCIEATQADFDPMAYPNVVYNPVSSSPGDDVLIEGISYKSFKVPIYDPVTGSDFQLTLLNNEPLSFFSINGLQAILAANLQYIDIDGYNLYVEKDCTYELDSSKRTLTCYLNLYLELGSMFIPIQMAGNSLTVSEPISNSDYDYTNDATTAIHQELDIDAHLPVFRLYRDSRILTLRV